MTARCEVPGERASGLFLALVVGAPLLLALPGCKDVTPPPVVATVRVTPSTSALQQGETAQLSAGAYTSTGTPVSGRAVVWRSSDEAIASVSASGLVTGTGHGTATISATVDAVAGTAAVAVVGRVASVVIAPDPLIVEEDSAVQARARLLSTNGVELAERPVEWASGDTSIARVTASGLVTGIRDGATTIGARSEGQSATANLTVRGRVAQLEVTPDSLSLDEPQATQLTATVRSRKGTALTNRSVTWTPSTQGVVRVESLGPVAALVTGIGHGRITLHAEVEGVGDDVVVAVRGRVARIALDTSRLDFVPGQDAAVSVQTLSSNGVVLTDRPVQWTASDPGVANIESTRVTAYSPGNATLTAASEGATAGLAVVVHRILLGSAGYNHMCVVVESVGVYCWGGNEGGQLGSGDLTPSLSPRLVAGSRAFTHVDGGGGGTCATAPENQYYCWGGSRTWGLTPTLMAPLTGLRDLVFGYNFICGAAVDGAHYCLGNNQSGQLGTGSSAIYETALTAPVAGQSLKSLYAGWQRACGLDAAGHAWCWGLGGVGDGTAQTRSVPVAALGGDAFARLGMGAYITCGQTLDDRLLCWGEYEPWGAATLSPRLLQSGTSFTVLTSGIWHVCGISAAGDALCWGTSMRGALGNGVTAPRPMPYPVAGGMKWADLTARGDYTCGTTTQGRMYCWGSNSSGELGDGTTVTRTVPTPVRWPPLPSP